MTRNFDHRVEVAFPIFDPEIQKELKFYFDLQWRDNVKARILNKTLDNLYQKKTSGRAIRAQEEIYKYLKNK
jgi:polyphosphate kinase